MGKSADEIECDDWVTVEHWTGEFRVTKINPATGGLHLVGRFLSGWVPPNHAHRVATGAEAAASHTR